jgi:hypothetical protein
MQQIADKIEVIRMQAGLAKLQSGTGRSELPKVVLPGPTPNQGFKHFLRRNSLASFKGNDLTASELWLKR